MKLKIALLAALMIGTSASAYTVAYESDAGGRYRVSCDNGSLVGWARVNGSGFWSSQETSEVDKNRDVVFRAMVRSKGGSCS